MIKFCAINENSTKPAAKNDNNSCSSQSVTEETVKPIIGVFSKEKEEFRIMKLYHEALGFQMKLQFNELIDALEEILTSSLMKEKDLTVRLQVVKASSYKLLANTYKKINDHEKAYICYQMAIKFNQQDVNLWYGIGVISEKLKYWENAITSYENVLKINNSHWPALDSLIIVTFALSYFEKSIDYCERALNIDCVYEGAIYVLQSIFRFQPNLKSICNEFLQQMPNILTTEIDQSVSDQISLRVESIRSDMREKRTEQQMKEKIETVIFKNPMKSICWESLTRSVLKLFQHLKETNKLEALVNMSSIAEESQLSKNSPTSAATPDCQTGTEEPGVIPDEEPCPTTSLSLQPNNHNDYDVIIEHDTSIDDCNNDFRNQATARITRNSVQLLERVEESTQLKKERYYASLLRKNVLNEVHEAANQTFSAYMDSVSRKREMVQTGSNNNSKPTSNCYNYKAKSLNNSNQDDIVSFIQSFEDKNVTIIAIGWRLVQQLIRREHLSWPGELIDCYLSLSSLVRNHVSGDCLEESESDTLLSIKRLLFELEILIDRKQSDLEGKVYKREFQFCDFLSSHELEELSNKIMQIQLYHSDTFASELNRIQLRILWLKYILSDLGKNEEELKLILHCIKRCVIDNDIPVLLRPNCLHHSLITLKKVDDNLSASFNSLKMDSLHKMYQNEEYKSIIDKTNSLMGAVVLPRDDYAEDINNYLIQISFHGCSYNKILMGLLKNPPDESNQNLARAYTDNCVAFEEITALMDILIDPKKKNRAPLTDRQFGFLSENYFKVGEIILTNITNLLRIVQQLHVDLIGLVAVGDVARFIVLSTEYFYDRFMNKITDIQAGHVWCLYEHFKCLELYDSAKFNQSVTYDPSEELDLPPSLNFLSLVHDYLGTNQKCGQSDGSILKFILGAASEYLEEIQPKFLKARAYVANHGDVHSLLDQSVYCIRAVLRRPHIDKSRKPLDHNCSEKISINLDLIDILLPYLAPDRVPEIDSVKSLSISIELNNLLLEIIDILPESIFQHAYSEKTIRDAIESESPLNFTVIPPSKYSKLFYFVGDHYFKNNEFEKALEYYIKNLRFSPVCFDSWAGIALIYYKRFELKFNMMDSNSESLDSEEVMKCLNSFNHAISLDPDNMTILIERACFCYEVHSYASRIIKKSMTRDIRESFVKVCEILATTMLELAKESYQMALDSENYRDDKEEKWLYHYMLSKCMEKSDDNTIIDVLDNLNRSLISLDKCGAKYVRRVVLYTKIPYRAVEVVEVYYKYHASVLKCLIKNQDDLLNNENQATTRNIHLKDRTFKKIDQKMLLELRKRLISMNQSPFIVNVGKKNCKGGAKKRANNKVDEYPEPTKMFRQTPSPELTNNPIDFSIDLANIAPEDVEDDCLIQEIILPNQPDDVQSVFEQCIDYCKSAMETVLQRLPLHYKAMYHLANIYYSVPHMKDLEKSYEYLMGSSKNGKSTINGLFKDRKSSNFFSGVWRIPVADIDRYGSFAYHMYRSMNLLLGVLRHLKYWNDLIHLTVTLRKSASSDKKGFLSDADRQMLLRKSMGHALCSVTEWLMNNEDEISKTDLFTIQTLYYLSVKQSQGIDKMRVVLNEAFNRCSAAKDLYRQMMSSENGLSIEAKTVDHSDRPNIDIQVMTKVLSALREGKK